MTVEDGFKGWIGKSEQQPEEVLSQRLVSQMQATFGEEFLFSNIAPLGCHWCLSPPFAPANELGADGHPQKGGFLPPIPLPRRMWAGGSLEFISPLNTGDQVQKSSTITKIEEKTGRSGALCFVTIEHEFANGSGTAIMETQNIVYREAAKGPISVSAQKSETQFDHKMKCVVNEVMLFRYSAMTFNGHRVHYDLSYTRDVEFYPGLVIHGPLQATLLMNFAAKILGKIPSKFDYRGTSPATGPQTLMLGATEDKGGLNLSVLSEAGVETMKATAL